PSTSIYTLSLHDALPISLDRGELPDEILVGRMGGRSGVAEIRNDALNGVSENGHYLGPGNRFADFVDITHANVAGTGPKLRRMRSEEHTSELQSRENLVC